MRSFLFVPADSEKKIAKALSVGADALILDLEDAVAAPNKAAARPLAAAFVTKRATRRADRGSMCASTLSTRHTGATTLPA